MAVRQHNLTEVELTLEETAVRDMDTDEETTKWEVNHPDLERPCRADTPQEALDIFGSCLETDNEDVAIDLGELAE